MPVDTSSYNTQTQPFNPLQTAGQAVGISNALQQNKNMQLANQQGQVALNSAQADLAMKHIQYMNQSLSMLASDPNLTQAKITNQIAQAVADKRITPTDASNEIANLPPNDTPEDNHSYVIQHLIKVQSNADQLAALTGTTGTLNNGQAQQTGVFASPYMQEQQGIAGFNPTSSISNKLSPGDRTQQRGYVIPQGLPNAGQSVNTTVGQQFDDTGNIKNGNALGVPAPMGQGQGSPTNPPLVNSLPGNSGNALNVMPNAVPGLTPPGALHQGDLAAGLPPGAEESIKATAENSAQNGINLSNRAQAVPDNKAIYDNMNDILNSGDFSSGSVAQKLRDSFKSVGLNPQSVASQEEFSKLANMIGQKQFQAIGGTGTDAKLESGMSVSPNTALSNLGNKGIIALLKGNEDAIQIKNNEWQKYKAANGNDPTTYQTFSQQFNQQYDPRVFQAQYLSPTERSRFLSGMAPTEKAQYLKDYQIAGQNGWIK